MSKSGKTLLEVLQAHTAQDVMDFIKAKKESDLSSDDGSVPVNIIELEAPRMTPLEGAQVLWKHNILSAPIWHSVEQKYVGFLDQRDLLGAVVQASVNLSRHASDDDYDDDEKHDEEALQKFHDTVGEVLEEQENTLLDWATKNPFCSCTSSASLVTVAGLLTDPKYKAHRAAILNPVTGRCVFCLTQGALLQFLVSRLGSSPEGLTETLTEANFPYLKPVISIGQSASAADAFLLLSKSRLSGIAVVADDDEDEESMGILVGNTSARDIKYAAMDGGWTSMRQNDIISYLALIRQLNISGTDRYPTCQVHDQTATMEHVVKLLAKTGYHRLFVKGGKRKTPVGVISILDILKYALESS
jgi:CBS domain-containing protein